MSKQTMKKVGLWLATILAGASLAWKLLRLAARLLFVKKLERVPA